MRPIHSHSHIHARTQTQPRALFSSDSSSSLLPQDALLTEALRASAEESGVGVTLWGRGAGAGAAGEAVGVGGGGGGGGGGVRFRGGGGPEAAVEHLLSMGFGLPESIDAAARFDGDLGAMVDFLFASRE